ncbi:MAG TPA: hypothetical protein VFA27_13300 [Vicinamibacterales bacterium]|nr:hypothetical protein [Vicinamibacterales bacterium]
MPWLFPTPVDAARSMFQPGHAAAGRPADIAFVLPAVPNDEPGSIIREAVVLFDPADQIKDESPIAVANVYHRNGALDFAPICVSVSAELATSMPIVKVSDTLAFRRVLWPTDSRARP